MVKIKINLNKCMPCHKCFQLNFIAIHFLENFSLHKKTIMGVYVKKNYICDWNVVEQMFKKKSGYKKKFQDCQRLFCNQERVVQTLRARFKIALSV